VRQGIFQRIFGIGDMGIGSAAHEGVEIVFGGIKNPVGVKDKISELKKK